MSTEVDNKQNPVVASEEAAKDKPAAEAPAVTVAAEEAKPAAAAAADNAGGDATKDEAATEPAKEEDAVAAAAPAEAAAAPAKPEPPVKYNVHRQNFEKDIVYLYQFSRTPVLPSLSPYCLKVETWLRLAGLKYEVSVLLSTTATILGRREWMDWDRGRVRAWRVVVVVGGGHSYGCWRCLRGGKVIRRLAAIL